MLNTRILRIMRKQGAFNHPKPHYNQILIGFIGAILLSFLIIGLANASNNNGLNRRLEANMGILKNAADTRGQYISGININKLADAIYMAEGGNKTRHPYGILKKYKVTTPRQACINTIKSNLRRWNGKGDFIEYLGKTYCPIGASNDPSGLNKNWVKNVKYYYGLNGRNK